MRYPAPITTIATTTPAVRVRVRGTETVTETVAVTVIPPRPNKRVFVVGAEPAFRGCLHACSVHSGFPLVSPWFPLKRGVLLDVSRLAGGAF